MTSVISPPWLVKLIKFMVAALILKVTMSVVMNYRDYYPPDFQNSFLNGRESYFFGVYRWVFYAHIFVGPVTLVSGLLLTTKPLLQRFPRGHRILGRVHVGLTLLVIVPTGMWLSLYASRGPIATMSFLLLSFSTAASAVMGWRAAIKRQFAAHQAWMFRCYLMLCSAISLRLMGGFVTVFNKPGDWIEPISPWLSWLVPLLIYETCRPYKPSLDFLGSIARSKSATE